MADAGSPRPEAKKSFEARLCETVMAQVRNVNPDNLKCLQVVLARSEQGREAMRMARRTETVMRRVGGKAIDLSGTDRKSFFEELDRLDAKLREKIVGVTAAQQVVDSAASELERALGGYDRVLEEIWQLVRTGVRKPEAPAKTPTKRAAAVTPSTELPVPLPAPAPIQAASAGEESVEAA